MDEKDQKKKKNGRMINRSRKSDLYHFKLLFDFYFRLFSYIVSIMNYRFKLENLALKIRDKAST